MTSFSDRDTEIRREEAKDLREAYERGRTDAKRARRRHPVAMTLTVIAAAVGVVVLALAAVNGSFSGAGTVVDQNLATAATQAEPVARAAASEASQAVQNVADDVGKTDIGKTGDKTAAPRSKRAPPARRPRLGRVEVVANVASGGVGPDAPDQLAAIFAEYGLTANICTPEIKELGKCLASALASDPDLLVILAGDGTARAAAELAGPKGPMIAPLPGGTMNMLPHAVYGVRPWPEALRLALDKGEERLIGGGKVEGHHFLCGAILGSPALWAPAREAMRDRDIGLAWMRARRAVERTFTGRLRYEIDGQARGKAEALLLMCPVASKALDDGDRVLEAAGLDVRGAAELMRLGLNAIVRDWRADPSVDNVACRKARVWSARSIPAILDGETVRLKRFTEITYVPAICRLLAPPRDEA